MWYPHNIPPIPGWSNCESWPLPLPPSMPFPVAKPIRRQKPGSCGDDRFSPLEERVLHEKWGIQQEETVIYTVPKQDGSAIYKSARKDGADFWKFDSSTGPDISLPRFIVGCAIYATQTWNRDVWCLFLMLLPLTTMQNLWNVYKLGVAPSHHLFLHFWVLVGFAALATGMRHVFPRCFGRFLRDPAFSAVFWGDLQPLLGVAPSILTFLGLGLQVCPRECTVYSWGVLVDFLQILHFQQFVVGLATLFWGLRQCIKVTWSPFLGLRHLFLLFCGLVGFACSPQHFGRFLWDPAFSVSCVLRWLAAHFGGCAHLFLYF